MTCNDTITGWPGGKPNADDTYRPERAKPYPKRVVVFSPHPDDDVISMGGTIRRLVEQKHDVHVAYETSGNIAVGDEEVIRFLHFINGFNQIFNNSEDQVINDKYTEIRKYLKEKKDGDMDTRDILTIKGLIRRGEARTACTYNNIPLDHCHFLDLPFYETGKIQKNPISEADVEIVRNLLREVNPIRFSLPATWPTRTAHTVFVRTPYLPPLNFGKRRRCQMVEGMPHLDVPRCMGRMGNRKHRDGCAHQPGRTACQA